MRTLPFLAAPWVSDLAQTVAETWKAGDGREGGEMQMINRAPNNDADDSMKLLITNDADASIELLITIPMNRAPGQEQSKRRNVIDFRDHIIPNI